MLVDTEIKNRFAEIFATPFCPEKLGCISYDVSISRILDASDPDQYILQPGETVMIETEEEFTVPADLSLSVGEKNSLIRTGIQVSGPRYFPGHHSKGYLRVTNLSPDSFRLKKGMAIAQLFFESLDTVPEHPYQSRKTDSFSDETRYKGFSTYEPAYKALTKQIEKAADEIQQRKIRMYANMLILMGTFTAIFFILITNFFAVRNGYSASNLTVMNVSLCAVLLAFLVLAVLIVRRAEISRNS